MKLVTFSDGSGTRIGAQIDRAGQPYILDLSIAQPALPTSMIAFLEAGAPAMQAAQQALESAPATALRPAAEVTLLAPLPRPTKIICIGHNYTDHRASGDLPEYPTFFSKYHTCVIGPEQAIVLPALSQQVDNEAELAVIIGRAGRHIPEEHAMEYVAGYTIFNDVSARDYVKRSSQWMLSKTFDTFGPMGPALVTRDEVADPANLEIVLKVNDQEVQHDSTRKWIFALPFVIAYLSEVMTLEPGDLISTGTPSRVGDFGRNPAYLKPGDRVSIRIDPIGELRNIAAAPPEAA